MTGFRVGLIAGILGTVAVAAFMGARTVDSVIVASSWKAPGGFNVLFQPTVNADGGLVLQANDIVVEGQVCPQSDISKVDGGAAMQLPCENVRRTLNQCTFTGITDLSTNAQKRKMARKLRECVWEGYPASLTTDAQDP
jgi:hypothetical protein